MAFSSDGEVKTIIGSPGGSLLSFIANDERAAGPGKGYADNTGILTITAVITTHRKDLDKYKNPTKVEDANL